MKVLLLQDIPGVGRKNEVKDLKPGYARSFIVSKRAIIATPQLLKAVQLQQKKKGEELSLRDDLLLKTIQEIDGKKVTLKEKVSEAGHLYHGIAKTTITEAIKKELHISLPEEALLYEKPLKEKGEFPLDLLLHGKKKGEVIVAIEPL